jgi:hypothetical protein
MAWFSRKRVCRVCGCTELTRYHRSFWMKLFKGSQLLRCRQCRSTILLLRDKRPLGQVASERRQR